MSTFDVIVIGAGPVGENAAGRCAERGLSAAIVERELVGGECSYWGCIHRLWHAVPSFPTVSEVWLRLLEAYGL